jgi:hypothetical protein
MLNEIVSIFVRSKPDPVTEVGDSSSAVNVNQVLVVNGVVPNVPVNEYVLVAPFAVNIMERVRVVPVALSLKKLTFK